MDEQPAAADDFRMENQVFAGDGKEPASRSTTIFCDGVVYDYLGNEVIVFDKAAAHFTLLDTVRRVRTGVTCRQVTSFTERLQQSAAAADDPFLLFLAAPEFDERFDKASRELTLSSSWMTYRLLLVEAGSRAVTEQYREFSDWYAKLNTVLHPGSKPPFARLLVNAAMAKYGTVAKEVFLTLTPNKKSPPQRIEVRSRHQFVRRLAQSDRDRVTRTREFMTDFKTVGFGEYRKRQ